MKVHFKHQYFYILDLLGIFLLFELNRINLSSEKTHNNLTSVLTQLKPFVPFYQDFNESLDGLNLQTILLFRTNNLI